MGEIPLPVIIAWLVYERFGGYDAATKIFGQMQHIPGDQAAEAEAFRGLLKRAPEEHVRRWFHERLQQLLPAAKEAVEESEAALFFNRLNAFADFNYWAMYPFWSLQEVVSLSLGREPRVVNWGAFEAEGTTTTLFAARYRQLGDLIHRCIQAGTLSLPVEPALYVAWCRQMNMDLPAGLTAAVEAHHGRAFDWPAACMRALEMFEEAQQNLQAWSDAYDLESTEHAAVREQFVALDSLAALTIEQMDAERVEYAAEIEALKAEHRAEIAALSAKHLESVPKELSWRERESVFKMLIGMAVGGYGLDPAAKRSDVVPEIVGDLERLGVAVSDETVRKYLKMSAQLLPPEAKVEAA